MGLITYDYNPESVEVTQRDGLWYCTAIATRGLLVTATSGTDVEDYNERFTLPPAYPDEWNARMRQRVLMGVEPLDRIARLEVPFTDES